MREDEQTVIVPIELMRKDRTIRATLCLGDMTLEDLLVKEEGERVLHVKEKEYFETLNFERRKASYLMGRYCAKKALSKQLNEQRMNKIFISAGVFNQPVVCAPEVSGIQVSIAHSGNLGCALVFEEEHPMGIDLETSNSEHKKTIDTQLTDEERQLLQDKWSKKKGDPYTWIWTVKEALSKVLRTGLSAAMSIYEVSELKHEAPYIIARYKHFAQYKAMSFFWKNAICSITLPRRTEIRMSHFFDFS